MGIKGLSKVIADNLELTCTGPHPIQGKLIVDGYSILHELYSEHDLDWCNGGRYARQHKVTVDYFEALVNAGIDPIVIVDGAGCKVHFDETVHRRNRTIKEIPERIEKYHSEPTSINSNSHHMPILSRQVFASSLKEINIKMYVADGKARDTIVQLANHFKCPILTNNSNYCVCNVIGGVIFFKQLAKDCREAYIYEQSKFVDFCKLRKPDLLYVMVAVLGDGCDISVRYLYHGRIKAVINDGLQDIDKNRNIVLNVTDFLRRFSSFKDFLLKIRDLGFRGMSEQLKDNCKKAFEIYNISNTISIDELNILTTIRCSKSCDLPISVLKSYRDSTFPLCTINAITLGQCTLEQDFGSKEEPPIPCLGRPVREFLYGLGANLMDLNKCSVIKEYYRSLDPPWKYEAHEVEVVPVHSKYEELSVTGIMKLETEQRVFLAKQALCEVLKCPVYILSQLEGESDKWLIIATLVTRFWAKYLIKTQRVPHPDQLTKALVLNFFLDLSEAEGGRPSIINKSQFSNPLWIKVYHTILEWQSLYRSVCSLNHVLLHPLVEIPQNFLFDGPLVMFLATYPSPDIIETYISRLDDVKAKLYKKVYDLVNS